METPHNGLSYVVYNNIESAWTFFDIPISIVLHGGGIIITYYRYRNTVGNLSIQYAESISISIDRNLKSSPYWGGGVTGREIACAHARIWKRGPREVRRVGGARALISACGLGFHAD